MAHHPGANRPGAALVDGESRLPHSRWAGRRILTSPIQKLPWGISHVQQYLPLLPLAIEQIDLGDYPLVISSSHLVAKGVLTSPEQLHISYVHTPVRYAWDQMHAYLRRSALARRGLGPWIRWQLHALRQWDQLSAARVDVLVANSASPQDAFVNIGGGMRTCCIHRCRWSVSTGISHGMTATSASVAWCLTSGWMWWWKPSIAYACR